jgi:hypothetical protein
MIAQVSGDLQLQLRISITPLAYYRGFGDALTQAFGQ